MSSKITLFLSFTNLVGLISRLKVTDEQLATGLFYFSCSREHVMNPERSPDNELLWFGNKREFAELVHKRILAAVSAAEREGRIIYRPRREECSFDQLDELLVKNGLNKLAFPGNEEDAEMWRYGGWGRMVASDAAMRSNPDLTIFGA